MLFTAVATAIASTSTDYTVPLDQFSMFSVGGRQVRIAVHDDGPREIRVKIDYNQPVVFIKRDGFDAADTETLIYQYKQGRLYYVNVIPDHIGSCVLRLKSD
jgi:hypothetical protein